MDKFTIHAHTQCDYYVAGVMLDGKDAIVIKGYGQCPQAII